MQTTKGKTTMTIRLMSFLIALSMMFSVSIEGMAAGGDGSGGGSGTPRTIDKATATLQKTTETSAEIELYFHSDNGGMRHYNSNEISDFTEHCSIRGTGAENALIECENTETDKYYSKEIVSISNLAAGTEYTFSYEYPAAVSNTNTYYLEGAVTCAFTTVAAEPELTLTSSLGDELMSTSRTTLKVEGGEPGYQYRFLIKNNDNNNEWLAQDYSTKNSVVWMAGPKGAANGKTITVDVKDAQNKYIATLQKTVAVSDVVPLKIDSIKSSKGTTLGYKTRTLLSANASGGTAPYLYQFIIKNNDTGKIWTAQTFNASNSVEWLAGPQGASKGKTITVEVKDATGQIVKKTLDVAVSNSDLEVVSISSSAGKNLKASDYTTLTATVKGGTGPYSYRFWIRNNDTGKEWTAQQFARDKNTCRWYAGPSGATKGKTVFVDVKDSKGNIVTETLDVNVE